MSTTPPRTHAVVWDMGGTLLDTYPEVDRALCAAVHDGRVGADDLREVSVLTHRSIESAIRELASRHGLDRGILDDAYAGVRDRWKTRPAPLIDGVPDVVDAVRRAGGLNLVVTHRDRDGALALLAGHRLRVDDVICPGDGYPRKPDPSMILAVLARNGVAPGDAVAVGDRPIDVQAAWAAGVRPFFLVTPGLPAPTETGEDPSTAIPSVRGLLATVADW
ncbi:HAD family hydrolase [Schaalia naturae]|uniref:HAD family hydrolase n=1 Tax=Schaalia naturae TaxID=635203 RepID=A0ABW2SNN1_9ACTO